MFLPPNTTSLIQPMDQGVISAFKRQYQRKYLDEVLVIRETEADMEEETRGKRTLDNIKAYNIGSAIYNMNEAWGEVKLTTLSNVWKKLIMDEDLDFDFHGFEASDFHSLLYKAGENVVTLDDVHEWIEENKAAEGHEILSQEQIVAAVTGGQSSDSEGSDVEQPQKVKMSEIREYADKLLQYVANSNKPHIQEHYDQLRLLRAQIIVEQFQAGRQSKIDTFFKSRTAKLSSPEPGPSQSTTAQPPTPELGPSQSATAQLPTLEEGHSPSSASSPAAQHNSSGGTAPPMHVVSDLE
ncbi:Tigger transposable element-derived protein 7 [Chionoecetes opilio]|uniref:Tigger transposable element-derived protein 7 n=1 Tax=Chionoecetes opilio TaxID=41210 RepID=A0A8J4YH91_CHIOP|nr:Tigger transposable element-derived protein 7 [Chionoecetes opilio]